MSKFTKARALAKERIINSCPYFTPAVLTTLVEPRPMATLAEADSNEMAIYVADWFIDTADEATIARVIEHELRHFIHEAISQRTED